jgi:hypothetical protein
MFPLLVDMFINIPTVLQKMLIQIKSNAFWEIFLFVIVEFSLFSIATKIFGSLSDPQAFDLARSLKKWKENDCFNVSSYTNKSEATFWKSCKRNFTVTGQHIACFIGLDLRQRMISSSQLWWICSKLHFKRQLKLRPVQSIILAFSKLITWITWGLSI